MEREELELTVQSQLIEIEAETLAGTAVTSAASFCAVTMTVGRVMLGA